MVGHKKNYTATFSGYREIKKLTTKSKPKANHLETLKHFSE